MAQTRVIVLNEVKTDKPNGWQLCFQYCRYEYGDGSEENGYRFIWRRPNGNLQGARGQARIPSTVDILNLVGLAISEGWGHYLCPNSGFEISEK
ncbi:hypothetical protein L0P54_10485 [Anaerosalibacter bizertensis]|uniref:Uncharacterized protein n=1 Tax=Anaerosalibacter bizertensis TaxID=932217 RepID=A0A9Q4FMR2_9FIRM|nr:hypothetical protein [Anaerosalibacter bizertensis]MBV1820429.1 hypothetical protein [Bacteroidales bacterium MSK.15.36]MCG4566019.1 hypothetical protein [Anaerosalibacter bizertensis]MCG4583415.1 hypothetical protein [Anaerosalibacter bizertensis]